MPALSLMKYCSHCGSPVSLLIPPGDHLPRHVCDACAAVHYNNPKIIAGCIVTWGDRVLICRRAIEPRKGFWTLPAGFMELGESIAEAAMREAREEACVSVELDALYVVANVIHTGQVHMMYRGRMTDEHHAAGPESLETALMHIADIPWKELAFPSVRYTLERFWDDSKRGHFDLHATTFNSGP
jgi:ADP-ribose pyrophosphatase YjhB (NUDIX family)